MAITILAIVGFLISAYASYCHQQVFADQNYSSVCDLSDRISCTKTFKSGYGSFLGLPMGAFGMTFYASVLILHMYAYHELVFALAIAGILASARLAYLLYFKVKSICLICNAIYVINILLLIFSYLQIA